MPVEIPIIETRDAPVYQQIAPEATQLRELGMTFPEIGKRLGIDRWTIGKAVRWTHRTRKLESE